MRNQYAFVVIIFLFALQSFFSNTVALNASDSVKFAAAAKVDVTVTAEKELFPVIAKFLSEGNENTETSTEPIPAIYFDAVSKQAIIPQVQNTRLNLPALVKWNISNNNEFAVKVSTITEIPEWTQPVISTFMLGANETKEIKQTPFGLRLLNNTSTMPSTIVLKVKAEDEIIFEETRNIKIRPADDMIWSLKAPWDTKSLIAAWVTPKNGMVERILANAKEKLYSRSLSGYIEADVIPQVKAIFNAVRNAKVSYVNSLMSFGTVGFTQRVRLPQESILQKSANCIDGAVLFASLFENIGLEPLIVLVPGHAFVGVRLAPNSNQTLFIETVLVGRPILESILSFETAFESAVKEGTNRYNIEMQKNPMQVQIIDIKKERENGIYPLW